MANADAMTTVGRFTMNADGTLCEEQECDMTDSWAVRAAYAKTRSDTDGYGHPAYYSTLAQARRAQASFVRKYPFYETRIVAARSWGKGYLIHYRIKSAS